MNKIINILLMGVIGILTMLYMVVIWMLGMIFLVFNEIPGSRRFRDKLHKLNTIIKEEFSVFDIFKKLGKAK